MQIILGIIFHFIGGFASGSFYVPYKKVKGWHWETYWIIGGLFSWLIVPPIAAWLTVPHFADIIQTSSSTFWWTYFWGVLWGIGGLMYGLGMRYLGMLWEIQCCLDLHQRLARSHLRFITIFIRPGKTTFNDLITNSWGRIVLVGVVLCLMGIFICGKAGVSKEREFPEEKKKESIKEFNLVKGLVVCVVSGILSACFNYGIEAGSEMADVADQNVEKMRSNRIGKFFISQQCNLYSAFMGRPYNQFCVVHVFNFRNKTFGDYTNSKMPLARNYFFAPWQVRHGFYSSFFMEWAKANVGNGASSWILHMAFIIFVANMWGFALKEWKGVTPKQKQQSL